MITRDKLWHHMNTQAVAMVAIINNTFGIAGTE